MPMKKKAALRLLWLFTILILPGCSESAADPKAYFAGKGSISETQVLNWADDSTFFWGFVSGSPCLVFAKSEGSRSLSVFAVGMGQKLGWWPGLLLQGGDNWTANFPNGRGGRWVVAGWDEMKSERLLVWPHIRADHTGNVKAYSVLEKGMWSLYFNGKRGVDYDYIEDPVLSEDAQHVGYAAKRNDRWFVVVDSKEKGPYDAIRGGILFSKDGQRHASVAKKGSDWVILLDDTEQPAQGRVAEKTFSQDGRRFAYVAEQDREWSVVCDGTVFAKLPRGENFMAGSLRVLADGRPVCICGREGKSRLYVGKQESEAFDAMGDGSPVVSAKERIGFVAIAGNKNRLVLDGQPGVDYDNIKLLSFTPDGSRAAYVCRSGERRHVIVGETSSPAHSDVRTRLFFSPNGRALVYGFQDESGIHWSINGVVSTPWKDSAEPLFEGERISILVEQGNLIKKLTYTAP